MVDEVSAAREISEVIASRMSERASLMWLSDSDSPDCSCPGTWPGGGSLKGLGGDGGGTGSGSDSGTTWSGSTKPAFVNAIRVNDSVSPRIIRMLRSYSSQAFISEV